jgi:hypothetical protein
LCNTTIDYSTVPGDETVPFTFELDLDSSILTPPPGVFQKFCYTVTGVGEDVDTQKDLSHWVLVLCEDITEEQIVTDTITVVIDGVPQEVEFGVNVVLQTDPTTGCTGLKFDFPLSKLGGVMNVCFELTETYPIGPNPVCVKGGQVVETGLSICGPVCEEVPPCETDTYQTATVCAPVVVTPTAISGPTRTVCCGAPVITPGERTCPSGSRNCYFTVSQKVCIKVPIRFGATAAVGEASIDCEEVSSDGCVDCD